MIYFEPCIRRIVVVLPKVNRQVTFSATDPIRTVTRHSTFTSFQYFGQRVRRDTNSYLELVCVTISNQEVVRTGNGRNSIDLPLAEDAEAILSEQFNWLRMFLRTVI